MHQATRPGVPFMLISRIALVWMILAGAATAAHANYYDSPRELDVTGSYTQAVSGMVFPESVAGFERTGIIRYNSEGTDESADYLLDVAGREIGISVYVYPVPADLGSELAKVLPQADLIGALSMLVEQFFANEEQGIVEVHSGADLLDESDISFSQRGVVYPGNVATFRYNEEFFGRVAKVRSQLYLYPMVARQWMVKYRVTYPDGVDSESQVNAFMAALPWTIRGLK
jgi:hypothetical protein